MSISEILGQATLETGVDLAGLDKGLLGAEARVAAAVKAMQAMLDSLHADTDIHAAALDALANKLASTTVASRAAAPYVVEQGGNKTTSYGENKNEIWGIRGPSHPGSAQNPIVTVIEAAKFTSLGSQAAAIGEGNVQDAQTQGNNSGLLTAADIAGLTSAISALAANQGSGSQLAAAGAQGVASPQSAEKTVVALDDRDARVLSDMAATLERLDGRLTPPSGGSTTIINSSSKGGNTIVAPPSGGGGSGGGHTVIVDQGGGGNSGAQRVFLAAPAGSGGRSTMVGPLGDNTVRLDGAQYAGLIAALRGGTGSGGTRAAGWASGSRTVDIFYHPGSGGGGGGGGGSNFLSGLFAGFMGRGGGGGGNGLAGIPGWGGFLGGLLPTAAIGSAGSFAGLGTEHLITVLLSLLGSATSAAAGGGLLASGVLGKLGVGGGSDLAVAASTASDTKLLYTDYTNLANAVAEYGKKSSQAAAAQQQLNFDIKDTLAGTQGVMAELKLAENLSAFNTSWDKTTSQARVEIAGIGEQILQVAEVYMPMVAQAATRNFGIIGPALMPLFTWLKGPDGVGIFNNLENLFAQELPYAMGAFDNGVELILRIMNIAAGDTGGFVMSLDHLLTRLNSMDNATLTQTVTKYVDDFRLWDKFVKLLVEDIYGLFHQDVGTGNAIINDLNGMLEKLRAYEESAKGSQQLQNIFEIHKTEILELLKLLPELGRVFGNVYLAVAPAMVAVMNSTVLPVINTVASVFADIASQSKIAADAIGLFFIGAKFGGWSKAIGLVKSAVTWLTGLGAAEKVVTGGAVTGSALKDVEALGVTGAGGAVAGTAGAGGLAGLLARIGSAGSSDVGAGLTAAGIAAAASAAIPLLLAGGAAFVVLNYLAGKANLGNRNVTEGPGGSVVVTGQSAPQTPGEALSRGAAYASVFQSTASLKDTEVNIRDIGDYANHSTTWLKAMVVELKNAAGVKVDGVSEGLKAVEQQMQQVINKRDAWNVMWNEAQTALDHFFMNTSRSLPSLYDDFNTYMRRIAATMGTNSTQGEKFVAQGISNMVTAIQVGMENGTIKSQQGIQAIWNVVNTGMKDGAITWDTAWSDIFNTETEAFLNGKISAQQYMGDVQQIMNTGMQKITQQNKSALNTQLTDLQTQLQKGKISYGQYEAEKQAITLASNQQSAQDMSAWIANFQAAMKGAGTLTAQGMQVITNETNKALGLFGANKLPVPEAIAWNNFQLTGAAGSNEGGAGHQGLFSGGKVTQPMYMVGEEAPAYPEMVLATNPAYRDRNLGLWAEAGGMLGVPGFSTGGAFGGATSPGSGTGQGSNSYTWPFGGPVNWERTDQGVDFSMAPGTTIGPIGDARIVGIIPDWVSYSGIGPEPFIWWQLLDGPDAGQYVYVAEQITDLASPGTRLSPNQAVARYNTYGSGIEYGFATADGHTLAEATTGYSEGEVTPAGSAMRALLTALASGSHVPILGGSGGGSSLAAAWTDIKAPQVKGGGAMGALVNAVLSKATAAANAYGQKKAAALGGLGTGSGAALSPSVGGPVAAQMYAALSGYGFNKVAAAGVIGNAWQESSLDPASVGSGGAGLLGWTPPTALYDLAAQEHVPWTSVALQMQLARQQTSAGDLQAMNSAGSAANAAIWWMNNWERPYVPTENEANRVAGANSAFAEGYASGGILGDRNDWWGRPGKAKKRGGSSWGMQPPGNPFSLPQGPGPGPGGLYDPLKQRVLGGGNAWTGSQFGYGTGPEFYGPPAWVQIMREAAWLNGLVGSSQASGGDAALMAEYLGYYPNVWAITNPNLSGDASSFIVTTDQFGNQVKPYVNYAALNLTRNQLGQEIGWQSKQLDDYRGALHLSKLMEQQIPEVIRRYQKHVTSLQHKIAKETPRLGPFTHETGKTGKGDTAAMRGRREHLSEQLEKDKKKLSTWKGYVSGLNTLLSNISGDPSTLGGITGIGGDIGSAYVALLGYQHSLAGIGPGMISTALTTANDQFSGSGSNSALASLLQQELVQNSEMLAVSQAQYAILANPPATLPPYGGSFYSGGIVPGAPGEPRTIIAHGGEEYLGVGASRRQVIVKVCVEDGAVDPNKIKVCAENAFVQMTRTTARNVRRALPSRGGGQLRAPVLG